MSSPYRAFLLLLFAANTLAQIRLPQHTAVSVQKTPTTGVSGSNAYFVPAGGDLQAALSAVQFGGTVIVEAGSNYKRDIVFPAKSGGTGTHADYITVQTSGAIPPPGSRVTPRDAAKMFRITATAGTAPVTINGSYWKIIGMEVLKTTATGVYTPNLVDVNGQHIMVDRSYIHTDRDGTDDYYTPAARGISIGSGADDITVTESRIAGFRTIMERSGTVMTGTTDSTQAILIPTNARDVTIHNNWLEAWFTPLFVGSGWPESPNQALVSHGATATQAVVNNVNNLKVGDLIAFDVRGLKQSFLYDNSPVDCAVAKVDSITGNHNGTFTLTYRGWGGNGARAGAGNPLVVDPNTGPSHPAYWSGNLPTNITVTQNNLVENTAAALFVFRHRCDHSNPPQCAHPKGYMEIKNGKNVIIDGNIFQGFHSNITLTARNQAGTPYQGCVPWARIENLQFTNNWLQKDIGALKGGEVFTIQLEDNEKTSVGTGSVTIRNNLIESGGQPIIQGAWSPNVTVDRNTFVGTSGTYFSTSSVVQGYTFFGSGWFWTNNILYDGVYGWNCPQSPFTQCWPGLVEKNNAYIAPQGSFNHLAGNSYPRNLAAVGFADPSTHDYRLSRASRYKKAGTDRLDLGVIMDQMLSRIGATALGAAPYSISAP